MITKHADILRHMLGVKGYGPRSRQGTRNYFCAGIGTDDYDTLMEMWRLSLVRVGIKINDGTSQYFHATLEGCQAIELSKAATNRALGKDK